MRFSTVALIIVCALVVIITPVAVSKDTNPKLPASRGSESSAPISLVSQTKISLKDAEELSLKQVAGKVRRVELEWDDHRLQYEFEICQGKLKKSVTIDAISGNVIEVDMQFLRCEDDTD
ncbi:MAG: PepSY domain-containing protein [Candidatus Obscuribacterales bacterium]|nr:PepSY domain-containing protein [Candidatus Obscuribacterales bacterium]